MVDHALHWLHEAGHGIGSQTVLRTLLANTGGREEVVKCAFKWIDEAGPGAGSKKVRRALLIASEHQGVLDGDTTDEDALFDKAIAIVGESRLCSTSFLQRKLSIGYNDAARLLERMKEEGIVLPDSQAGKRKFFNP